MEENEKSRFVVTEENWSLHRKGHQDQQRHLDKIKEVLQSNLPDLISEENIILSSGKNVVKIPIRSLDEFKIRYNHDKSKHVGQGTGDSKIGDIVAQGEQQKGQQGTGKEAGDQPGQDIYETEVTMEEIEEMLFKELELPDLKQKDQAVTTIEDIDFTDIRKKGLIGNLDKKRTLLSAIKRNAMEGKAEIAPILEDDLRFKTWNPVQKHQSKAVVLAMMDTSGSMGKFEKYMARSFFFWMTKFLRTKYETVDIEFIAHHTEAKVVTEENFFNKGESGGTKCSSAYEKALHLIKESYPPSSYNIYPVHFSDGENMTSDNRKCLEYVEELLRISNMFGYAEVNEHRRMSTLMSAYKSIEHPKFNYYILQKNRDVYFALKKFFEKRTEGFR
ncbi:sporulation protein YhbH [Sporosarcina sp.]|uniref:sporulation protein YhbH n=1 Tax=Sporosarcina sp. TaxID=49982 RepID=UPI00262E0A6D|nr:sporulation protein YhbH [Sporosarcina sp.]